MIKLIILTLSTLSKKYVECKYLLLYFIPRNSLFFSGVEPVKDDDFIFEDFARLRLKGHDPDDTEA